MRPVRNVENATLWLPCTAAEHPKVLQTTIIDVYSYGRALPRGLVLYEKAIWIVCDRGNHWELETKVTDVVAYQRGMKFVTWRNYLRRIVRWPWQESDFNEVMEMAKCQQP